MAEVYKTFENGTNNAGIQITVPRMLKNQRVTVSKTLKGKFYVLVKMRNQQQI